MADERVPLVDGDVLVAHAVEIIVGRVVLADVVEAEAEVLALRDRAPRRAELAGCVQPG